MTGSTARVTEQTYDIVVSGGSFSGPAAALAASRVHPTASILLIEPTDWLGGQATSQGVSAIDNAWHPPAAELMRTNPGAYYPVDYLEFLNRLKNAPASAPGEGIAPNGTGWVSREVYDSRTAAWVLDQMIAERKNITLMKLTVVKAVSTAPTQDQFGRGRIITEISLITRAPRAGYEPFQKFLSQEIRDWYSPRDSADFTKQVITIRAKDLARGLAVLDASELGDVLVLSGAYYSIGRELHGEEMGDDGSLPPMDEDGSQATVYPFCMTGGETSDESDVRNWWGDFDAYYKEQCAGFYRIPHPHTWDTVWTYRRLKLGSDDIAKVEPGDVTMQNWYPGNDYPYGTILLNKTLAQAEAADWRGGVNIGELARAEKHAVGWYFWMKENRSASWDTHYLHGNDPLNMMGTAHGLSKFPYIRCTRRGVGIDNFRITGRYFSNTEDPLPYTGKTSWRFYDSVGIANYAVDIHPTKISSGIEPPFEKAAPFYIPLRALGSSNVRNLMLAGKLIAGTYISNSAYRVHSTEWAIGSAAGAAAAVMQRDGITNYDLMELPKLRMVQGIVRQNSPISWAAFDKSAVPPYDGDLIVNDLKPLKVGAPFRVEVFHGTAARARVYHRNELLGETTTRVNGRLVLGNLFVNAAVVDFRAELFDSAGQAVGELRLHES